MLTVLGLMDPHAVTISLTFSRKWGAESLNGAAGLTSQPRNPKLSLQKTRWERETEVKLGSRRMLEDLGD